MNTQINLTELRVESVKIDIKKGFFVIGFDNGKSLVCRMAKSLTDGGYRRAINLNALGIHQGKPLRKNGWLQTPGHHTYENWDDICNVIAREAQKVGLPIL